MKLKPKYYTPSIEEFHVGFEYQYRYGPKDEWHEASWSLMDRWELDEVLNDRNMNDVSLRVKHLNIDDIKALGWNEKGEILKRDEGAHFGGVIGTYSITVTFDGSGEMPPYVSIEWTPKGLEDSFTKFAGVIRNKSELKKLMNQLNIKNEK